MFFFSHPHTHSLSLSLSRIREKPVKETIIKGFAIKDAVTKTTSLCANKKTKNITKEKNTRFAVENEGGSRTNEHILQTIHNETNYNNTMTFEGSWKSNVKGNQVVYGHFEKTFSGMLLNIVGVII